MSNQNLSSKSLLSQAELESLIAVLQEQMAAIQSNIDSLEEKAANKRKEIFNLEHEAALMVNAEIERGVSGCRLS